MNEDEVNLDVSGANLADDIIMGASEISKLLFGSAGYQRRVYHLARSSKLPVFRLGASLCVRKSVLIKWIRLQEQKK